MKEVSIIEMGALARGQGNRIWKDAVPTLRAKMGDNQPCVMGVEQDAKRVKTYDMKQHHNPQESDTLQLTTSNCSTIRGDSPLVKEVQPDDQGGAYMGTENEPAAQHNTVVRRLTPIECERLQGFPDDYTNIPWSNKDTAPDSRRYKALGNSMAVPVMAWIGNRMDKPVEVVYDAEAIRKALLPPLTEHESDSGQMMLF